MFILHEYFKATQKKHTKHFSPFLFFFRFDEKLICCVRNPSFIVKKAIIKFELKMSNDHSHNAHCECKPSAAVQSLDEMDFERGIWSAALYNDTEKLKKFIDSGQTNAVDATGYTALHYSSRNGHLNICEQLVRAGANVNAGTRSGDVRPLCRAAMMGHDKIVQLLLRNGADIFHQDNDGNTALHKAAQNHHQNVIKILLNWSSESPRLENICNKKGVTAIDIFNYAK